MVTKKLLLTTDKALSHFVGQKFTPVAVVVLSGCGDVVVVIVVVMIAVYDCRYFLKCGAQRVMSLRWPRWKPSKKCSSWSLKTEDSKIATTA